MKINRFRRNYVIAALLIKSILIGVLAGLVVGLFREAIEKSQQIWLRLYHLSHQKPILLVGIILILIFIGVLVGFWMKQQPHIAGSGIPEVELQLKGKLYLKWWPILWRKFIGGILAIGSGLLLGREGPSIQLGSSLGQCVGEKFGTTERDRRILLATGAASGLAAAFNAPLGGTLFVLEEVFHNFSPRIWINSLAGTLAADFVTSNLFGLRPVLQLEYTKPFPLNSYWLLIFLGLFLGILSFAYQKILLMTAHLYDKIKILPRWWHSFIPMVLLVPIAYYFPVAFGGGNTLILKLPHMMMALGFLVFLFLLRFIFSIVSYDSGLPGGIFLPILTLGALIGAIYGGIMTRLGVLPASLTVNLIIFAMAGYFSGIVRSPFTAIILMTEMVGSLSHLMPLAVVSLVAYLVDDFLGRKPIYESLSDRITKKMID